MTVYIYIYMRVSIFCVCIVWALYIRVFVYVYVFLLTYYMHANYFAVLYMPTSLTGHWPGGNKRVECYN